jgi:type I restriction enzyme S subunit
MSEVNLPEGWFLTKFTEVLDIQGGTQPPKAQFIDEIQEGYVRLLQIRDFGAKPVPTFIPDTSKLKKCGINDLLIGRYGASLGRICSGMEGAYNVALAKVISGEYLHKPFLKAYLESEMFQQPLALLSRSAQNGFNKDDLATFDFALLPLAEQKVIADKLDTLLAQVGTTKARLDRIPKILKIFRQAVLSAAVSGKLTEEWREGSLINESSDDLFNRWLSERLNDFESEESELLKKGKIKKARKFKEPSLPDLETSGVIDIPDLWLCVSVSQFAECLDSQRIPVKKDARVSSSGLYPYFGANGEVDRVDGFIFDDDLVLVTEDETFYGRVKPIAYRYSGKCWVNNHAHVLRARTKEANDYLCYALMYYKVIPWLSGTTGRAKLTQAALNALPIGLPPLVELEEIVRRVEELFAFANSIEQKTNAALERVNNLTQSILAKAFRGELTADWRAANHDLISGENSAEALLAKIQAEREKLALEKKAAKKPRKKKA